MIGQRIAQLRKARGWTQAELAARAGVHPNYITLLETGRRPDPGITLVCKLARALGVSVDAFCPDLLTSDPIPEPATVPA